MTEAPGTNAPHRGNRSVFLLALCAPMLISILPIAIAPGVLLMAQEFGSLTSQLVLTLPAVVMIFGAAMCGYLAERWGRRAIIVGSLLIYAAGGAVGFVATDLTLLVASRVASGFSSGVLLTTMYAVTGEYYEGNSRERLLGFMTLASAISSVVMLTIVGMVVERFGWRAPFLFYTAGLLLVPLALAGLHKKTDVARDVMPSWSPVFQSWPIFLVLMTYSIGMFMILIQGPFLLEVKGITNPSTVGNLIAISGVAAGVAGAIYGFVRRVLGFGHMFVLISLSLGIALPLAAWAPGAAVFAVAAIIAGFALGTIEPTIASELLIRTPEPLHDRAMGVNVAALFFGQFLNPVAVALVHNVGGIVFAFQIFGLAYLIGAVLFFVSLMRIRRSIAKSRQ